MTTWKDSLQRRDEVRTAFIEGFLECPSSAGDELGGASAEEWQGMAEQAWLESAARKRLEKPLAP
jgi:hypothetical protein